MSEMIERVARALAEREGINWEAIPVGGSTARQWRRDERTYWLDQAAAAIKAMREPSEAMTCTGFDAAMGEISDDFDRIEVQSSIGRTVWHRMIDAALVGEG